MMLNAYAIAQAVDELERERRELAWEAVDLLNRINERARSIESAAPRCHHCSGPVLGGSIRTLFGPNLERGKVFAHTECCLREQLAQLHRDA